MWRPPFMRSMPVEQSLPQKFEAIRIAEHERLYDLVMGCIASYKPGGDGDYHEYGICGAGCFTQALKSARKWQLDAMDFWAFDSFQGLPPPHEGHLAMSEDAFLSAVRSHSIYSDKIHAVPGFYENSLTGEKQAEMSGRKVAFINIDCDLHDSAVPVFNFIEPLISEGTFIYVDDFHSTFKAGTEWGTARAFFEFAERSRWGFYPLMNVGFWGHLFQAYDPSLFKSRVF